jgi:diguanylate cyclase (GGDEF)-like protein
MLDPQSKPALVMVVDDEKALRLVLSHAMQKDGYQVLEAVNGAQCLELCRQRLPDLILLDAVMPIVDGFNCCAQLQQQFAVQCPPVLMITSLDDQVSVDQAFAAGAIDYVTKPIQWAVLRQRVRRLLQTQWAMAALHHKIEQERHLMAELEIANQTLKRLAALDGLTQIANRRRFDECLQHEWQRLAREQLPLSLILCDIDCFKPYNDTYGHQAGDECLKQVASLLDRAIRRPADLVARYGGEEFVVVLPNTTPAGAAQVATAIQAELRSSAIPAARAGQLITLSYGIAGVIPNALMAAKDLIAAADRALYQAKQEGRDRIVVGTLVELNQ